MKLQMPSLVTHTTYLRFDDKLAELEVDDLGDTASTNYMALSIAQIC